MNQATNLIQWKNLTDEQKDDFDLSKTALYMMQRDIIWGDYGMHQRKNPDDIVYRLKILSDEWYYVKFSIVDEVRQGHRIQQPGDGGIQTLRPAKPSEIPKPEPTLLERMGLKWPDKHIFLLKVNKKGLLSHDDSAHTKCQSMEDFIGYAYVDKENNEPFISLRPIHGTPFDKIGSKGIELPIAVLFGDFDR